MTADPLASVDLALAGWDERLRRMSDNLVALEGDPSYQLLASAGRRDTLTGATRERALPVLEAVVELFQHRERLGYVVARAKAVRASIKALTFWEKDEKLAELHRLLTEPSIELEPTEAPLSRRGLLDATYRPVTIAPDELLARMAQAFDEARDLVARVGHSWQALEGKLEPLQRELDALKELAADAGAGAEARSALEEAQRELLDLGGRVARDPLGAEHTLGQALLPLLAGVRARVEAELATRDRARGALERAESLAREVTAAHQAASRAVDEARTQVEGPPGASPQPTAEPLLEGLDRWREKLTSTVRAGRYQAAEVGLGRWLETATAYLELDRAAREQAEGLLAARVELAGRLSARRAQAAAFQARGATLPPALEELAREADALLHEKPVRLPQATAAVVAYEARFARVNRR